MITAICGKTVRRYESFSACVAHHDMLRDASGKGASTWPEWKLEREGELFRISYNGKLWARIRYVGAEGDFTQEAVIAPRSLDHTIGLVTAL